MRDEILVIDAGIVALLAQRAAITHQVGLLKERHGVPAYQHARHIDVIGRWGTTAIESGWTSGAQHARDIA